MYHLFIAPRGLVMGILVIIGSGKGLLPNGTTPLPEPMLSK